jgi:hypothetical protein
MAGGNLVLEENFFGKGGFVVGGGWVGFEDGRRVGEGLGWWSALFGRGSRLCAWRKESWFEAVVEKESVFVAI